MFFICVKGLRFSGVNDTDYRVYLLGNPVSILKITTFCFCHSWSTRSNVLMIKSCFSGGLVDKPCEFGIVCNHGGSGFCCTTKRFLNRTEKNRYGYWLWFQRTFFLHRSHWLSLQQQEKDLDIKNMFCTLSLRGFSCAHERRRTAVPWLAASLCTFLHHGPCALLPPLLPCDALQQHANRYQIPPHNGCLHHRDQSCLNCEEGPKGEGRERDLRQRCNMKESIKSFSYTEP